MKVSPKKMRKLLNAAWDDGVRWRDDWTHAYLKNDKSKRYRDVSRILEEAEKVDWSRLSKPDNVKE
jgi:hypothetical protein